MLKVYIDFAYTRDIYIFLDALVRKELASSCLESTLYQCGRMNEFHTSKIGILYQSLYDL